MFHEFLAPDSVSEAVSLRRSLSSAMYLAGGTEINSTIWPCRPVEQARTAISLAKLPLVGLEVGPAVIRIGSLVTIQALVDRPDLPPVLAAAVRLFANRNVRTMGTLGGNIGGNRSCSNIGPALLALGTRIVVADGSGEKSLPLEAYLENQDKTALIVAFEIPAGWEKRRWAVRKHSRTANDVSILSVAVSFSKDGGRLVDPVVAVNGATPRATRLTTVEKRLAGASLPAPAEIEPLVRAAVCPVTDIRGSESFKRHLAGVLVCDALREAAQRGEAGR